MASTELRKIIFPVRDIYDRKDFALRTKVWDSIDKEFCRLVGRLSGVGCRRTLEVELWPMEVKADDGEYDFSKFHPSLGRRELLPSWALPRAAAFILPLIH